MQMKVLFACGGSGGHINPALAMAKMIVERFPSSACAMAGCADSMERAAAEKGGLPFFEIAIDGFHRKEFCRNFKSAFLAFKAPSHAKKILRDYNADLVIGTGGYVTYPFIRAAHALHIPSLLFESNAIPGLAFKLSERAATRSLLQFEACLPHLRYPGKACVIGAPLRKEFRTADKAFARRRLGIPKDKFFFLSFGGSLGADAINRACISCMQTLRNRKNILHVHACGKRYFDQLAAENPIAVQQKRLLPYIDDMASYMCAADLLLCRAGAITLAEISHMGRAAILVPSPNVAADHQRKNAAAYQKEHAAWIMEESELSGETLAQKIIALSEDRPSIRQTEKAVGKFDFKETETLFYEAVCAVLSQRT